MEDSEENIYVDIGAEGVNKKLQLQSKVLGQKSSLIYTRSG